MDLSNLAKSKFLSLDYYDFSMIFQVLGSLGVILIALSKCFCRYFTTRNFSRDGLYHTKSKVLVCIIQSQNSNASFFEKHG